MKKTCKSINELEELRKHLARAKIQSKMHQKAKLTVDTSLPFSAVVKPSATPRGRRSSERRFWSIPEE